MLSLRGLICVTGVAAGGHAAMGAGTLHLILVPREAYIFAGETMLIDVYADWSGVSGGLSLASFKFDISGHPRGYLTGDVNDAGFDIDVSDGITSGANLLDFGGGQLPPAMGGDYLANPAYLGVLAYTDLDIEAGYSVFLGVSDFQEPTGSLNVYTSGSGSQSAPGSGHNVVVDAQWFDVAYPSPGTAPLLAGGAFALGRRRR